MSTALLIAAAAAACFVTPMIQWPARTGRLLRAEPLKDSRAGPTRA